MIYAQRIAIIHRHLNGITSALNASAQDSQNSAQCLLNIRRNVNGLASALEALERDFQAQQSIQSDGDRAAQAAQLRVQQQGPQEVKINT